MDAVHTGICSVSDRLPVLIGMFRQDGEITTDIAVLMAEW